MTITLLDMLQAGDTVELSLVKNNRTKKFKAKVYKVISEDELLLSAPLERGQVYRIWPGEDVLVTFYKPNMGLYDFYIENIIYKKMGQLSAIVVKKSSPIKKTQRREYFRVSYLQKVEILEKDKKEALEVAKAVSAYSILEGRDISGGGFRAVSNISFDDGEEVKGRAMLDNRSVEFKAKVRRVSTINDGPAKYDIAFEFVDLEKDVLENIISYIFKKERMVRSSKR